MMASCWEGDRRPAKQQAGCGGGRQRQGQQEQKRHKKWERKKERKKDETETQSSWNALYANFPSIYLLSFDTTSFFSHRVSFSYVYCIKCTYGGFWANSKTREFTYKLQTY